MHRRIRILLVAALTVAMLAAPALAAPVRVRATDDNRWSPYRQFSSRGQRVVWVNPTSVAHTVTSYGRNWSKDTRIAPGERTRRVFRRTGTFKYRCKVPGHSHLMDGVCHGMCGRIIVE